MVMNVFRLGGDLLHLASFAILFQKMLKSRTTEGLSLKTQELYLIVFLTRYLDLFSFRVFDMLHMYNFLMKVFYISASSMIVYFFRYKKPWCATYKAEEDSFRHLEFAIAPCALLALLINSAYTPVEMLWTFSLYLESVAILPQLILIQRYGNIRNITANYVFCLGSYRALYLINWIYRLNTESHYGVSKENMIVWVSGIIQTILYCDFFYYYVLSKYYGSNMLPQ